MDALLIKHDDRLTNVTIAYEETTKTEEAARQTRERLDAFKKQLAEAQRNILEEQKRLTSDEKAVVHAKTAEKKAENNLALVENKIHKAAEISPDTIDAAKLSHIPRHPEQKKGWWCVIS